MHAEDADDGLQGRPDGDAHRGIPRCWANGKTDIISLSLSLSHTHQQNQRASARARPGEHADERPVDDGGP